MAEIDIIIISLYLMFICWRGLSAGDTYHTADGYFLANRSLSWPVIGLSLFATNISTVSIIGLGGSGYQTGISVFNYEWTGALMLVIFAVFIAPYYIKNKLTTMPEFLERRFDSRSRLYFSFISIAVNILIDIAGALYAGSLFLRGIFPDINLYFFIGVMALVTGLYTVMGGLRAVVLTDSIQAVLLSLGAIVIAVALFNRLESWQEIQAALPADFFSLIRPITDPLIPWPTLIISLPILGFYFMCSSQHMVQRVLGAKSVDDGRKGAIFAGFLKLPLLFILILPGTMGRIVYPNLENANLIFPNLMLELLPAGILGLVLTGFIAALMSSIDSALTAAGSIATLDVYKRIKPGSSEKHLINMGKVFILVFVFIASTWAPFIDQFPTLWEYLQAVLAYLSPPVVTCFLFGLFWKKASADGAYHALLYGTVFALIMILNNYVFTFSRSIHFLYSATIIFLFSSLVMVLFSYISPTQPLSGDKNKLGTISEMKNYNHFSQEPVLSWYTSYKGLAILLYLTTALLVVTFW